MKKNVSEAIVLLLALILVSLFYFYIFKLLPLGVALVITGAGFAVIPTHAKGKNAYWIGMFGSWLYPIGVIYSFFRNGWKWGFFSIFLGFVVYRYARSRP